MRPVVGRMLRGVVCACCAVPLLTGCFWEHAEESGIVATVNGSPIRLADLEGRHDLGQLGTPQLDNPAVEQLRAAYGEVLAEMIVARLVRQELERNGLAVTAAELAAAEAQVRADYPGDTFDQMLLEEHIDVPRWREALVDRLALEKFFREILRQNIRLDVSEAANYYKEHIEAVTQPSQVRLLLVQGREPDAIKAALAAYRKIGQRSVFEHATGVTMQEVRLAEKTLVGSWREALKGLKPGDVSAVMPIGREHLALVLVERQPEAVLEPAKAYAQIETLLTAGKLEKSFDAWLAEALAGAKISVSKTLLAAVNAGDAATKAARRPDDQAELEAANKETVARDYVAGQARKTLAEKRAGTDGATTVPQAGTSTEASPASSSVSVISPVALPINADAQSSQPAAVAAATGKNEDAVSPTPLPRQEPNASEAALTPPGVPAPAPAAVPEALGVAAVSSATSPSAPAGDVALQPTKGASREVEFLAVKSSWIVFAVDDGAEERVYLKSGKPHKIAFDRKLQVHLGSPSEVKYRSNGRETTVDVGKKENRVLEFP